MKPLFDYDDIVKERKDTSADLRSGEKAWIVGVFLNLEMLELHKKSTA